MTTTTYTEPTTLCECGHEGYDGHDMRSVPPACMTPGCPCGNSEEECLGCGWDGYVHHHLEAEDGPRSGCCAHTCGRTR